MVIGTFLCNRRQWSFESIDLVSFQMNAAFPPTRTSDESKSLALAEYIDILFDILKSQKNVLIARNFQQFDKHVLIGGKVFERCLILNLRGEY